MTLIQIIQILKQIALTQPNIKSATDGSIYEVMNTNPSVKYDVVHFSQTTHQSDETTDYYGLNIFYVSRLEDSLEDNRLQIQSIGKEILDNIIRTFCENWGIDIPIITYTPFTQKFNDLCAGCYCNLRLEIPKEIICADDYVAEVVPGSGIKLQDIGITITQNGLIVVTPDAEYDGIGEIRIETNVPQSTAELQYKEVEYTENGEYTVRPDQDYDGLTEVAVSVDVPDRYDEGYDDGKEDGIEEQKGKLVVTSFTENDTYTRADGWSAVTVNVPQTGSTINNQEKWIRFSTNPSDYNLTWQPNLQAYVTNSPVRVSADTGYTGIEPAVVDIYQPATEAIALGEQNQKAKMVATAITENGEYGRPDGYSAITVNVPQTGSTDEDLIANLQGDYYVIPDGTDHLRDYAFYGTCFSSITIPTSVSAIGDYAFANNTCLTSMTFPSSVTAIGSYVLCGDTALEKITFEGTTPPTLGNTGNSLGDTAYTFPIFVPCQSIDAYKTAFGSEYAARIMCSGDTGGTSILDFVYETSAANQTITLFNGDAGDPNENRWFRLFFSALTAIEIDGVEGVPDASHIITENSVSSYTQTFATAGRHRIKYYVSSGYRDPLGSDPAKVIKVLLFSRHLDSSLNNDCPLVEANIGEGYEIIYFGAFADQEGLTGLTLPNTLTTLYGYPFENTGIIDVTIPASVREIGRKTFYSCSALTAMTFEGLTPPTLSDLDPLGQTAYTFPIYVPCQSLEAYRTTFGPDYSPRIQCKPVDMITAITLNVPSAITDSGTATTTYDPATATTNIRYTSSDHTIAAIDETTGVITVLEDGTVTICAYDTISGLMDCKTVNVSIFGGYEKYLTIIYDSITAAAPTKIMNVSGSNSCDYFIYNGVQYNIEEGQTGFTFPTTGRQACCYHLTSYTTVGSDAFKNCISILEVRVPEGVTTIGNSCFDGCTSLSSVTTPSTIALLGERAFADCEGFKYILIRATTPPTITDGNQALVPPTTGASPSFTGTNGTFVGTFYSGHSGEVYVPEDSVYDYINLIDGKFSPYSGRVKPFKDYYIDDDIKTLELVYTTSENNQYVHLWNGDEYRPSSQTSIPSGWTEMYEFKDSLRGMKVDGVYVPVDCYYRFGSAGTHTVELFLTANRIASLTFGGQRDASTFQELTETRIGAGINTLFGMAYYGLRNLTAATIENITDTKVNMGTDFFYYTNIHNMQFLGTLIPENGPGVDDNMVDVESIEVPLSAVDNYKGAWPDYANIITAIIP